MIDHRRPSLQIILQVKFTCRIRIHRRSYGSVLVNKSTAFYHRLTLCFKFGASQSLAMMRECADGPAPDAPRNPRGTAFCQKSKYASKILRGRKGCDPKTAARLKWGIGGYLSAFSGAGTSSNDFNCNLPSLSLTRSSIFFSTSFSFWLQYFTSPTPFSKAASESSSESSPDSNCSTTCSKSSNAVSNFLPLSVFPVMFL